MLQESNSANLSYHLLKQRICNSLAWTRICIHLHSSPNISHFWFEIRFLLPYPFFFLWPISGSGNISFVVFLFQHIINVYCSVLISFKWLLHFPVKNLRSKLKPRGNSTQAIAPIKGIGNAGSQHLLSQGNLQGPKRAANSIKENTSPVIVLKTSPRQAKENIFSKYSYWVLWDLRGSSFFPTVPGGRRTAVDSMFKTNTQC